MTAASQIVVIGAGIVGASIAYHLARRGAQVTVLDRGPAAGEATEKSFAWINASYRNPEPYYRLRFLSMQEYRRLEQEIEALEVSWQGCLIWDREPEELAGFVAEHASWGYDIRMVDRDEIAVLEPGLVALPPRAAYAAGDGTIDPRAVTQALLDATSALGADIRLGQGVSAFSPGSAGIRVTTEGGEWEVDGCVLAAGVASARFCDRLGIPLPMRSSPGVLAHSGPIGPLLNHVIEAPKLHAKQENGRIVVGEDFGGGPAPNDIEAEGQRLIELVQRHLQGAEDLTLERVTLGMRPIPEDGFPAIGFAPGVPGLYLATMHSGVTLAPAVGRFAAAEILDGVEVQLLEPYRPGRFAS